MKRLQTKLALFVAVFQLGCGEQSQQQSNLTNTVLQCKNEVGKWIVIDRPITTLSQDAALSVTEALKEQIYNGTYPNLPQDCRNCGLYMEPSATVYSFIVNKVEEVSSGLSTATGWGYKVTAACKKSEYVTYPEPDYFRPTPGKPKRTRQILCPTQGYCPDGQFTNSAGHCARYSDYPRYAHCQ